MESQVGLCCGLTEINGIGSIRNPKDVLVDLISNNMENFDQDEPTIFRGSFVLFTGASRTRRPVVYAERFRKFLESEHLGTVKVTDPVKNTNSGNTVTLYVWQVDHKALVAWWGKNNPDRLEEEETESEAPDTNDNW